MTQQTWNMDDPSLGLGFLVPTGCLGTFPRFLDTRLVNRKQRSWRVLFFFFRIPDDPCLE